MKKTVTILAGILLAVAGCAQQPTKGEQIVSEINANPQASSAWGLLCNLYELDSYQAYLKFRSVWIDNGGSVDDPMFTDAWNDLQRALTNQCGAF